jgi:peptidoglycan hydrolase-like protein with peptidoglycan-binding domain
MDASDCAAVKIAFKSSDAAWRHRIRLKIFVDGVEHSDILLAANDDRAIGTTKTVNASQGLPQSAACQAPPASQVGVPAAPVAFSQAPSACVLGARITRFLAPGANGSDVSDLQRLLGCLGFFPQDRTPTGFFGSITQQSVSAFKTAHGIANVGSVGPLTRAALNAYAR